MIVMYLPKRGRVLTRFCGSKNAHNVLCRRMFCTSSSKASFTMPSMDDVISLCKRRGFVHQPLDLYNTFGGFYDYGSVGVELKNNIKASWWKHMVQMQEDVVGMESCIISPSAVWEASGHLSGFSDPMVDCKESKMRYRADHLFYAPILTTEGQSLGYICLQDSPTLQDDAAKEAAAIAKKAKCKASLQPLNLQPITNASPDIISHLPSPATKKPGSLTPPREFNLMFSTSVGAVTEGAADAYLRPETAQGIFVNFKQIQTTSRMKIPFGIAQIGKSFRNEITPRNFIFRSREFEQMEIEYFIPPEDAAWQQPFDMWLERCRDWLRSVGISEALMKCHEHSAGSMAHYAKACTDIMFQYPFGWQELMGVAARGSYDLEQHGKHSGKNVEYYDQERKIRFVPHCIEPSIGVDRLLLAVIVSSWRVDEIEGESRHYLAFPPSIAPVKVSVLPLMKNTPEIVDLSKRIYNKLRLRYNVEYDVSGAIGRRYRRADEIGTPFCITVDFDSLQDNTVTVRYRDTTKQERIPINSIMSLLGREIDGFGDHEI